jgi:drug/metabolite transporter (DMT)-like permease
LVGALIALTTSLAAAIGTVIVRYLKLGQSLLQFTGFQLLTGGVLLILLSAIWGEPMITWNWSFVGIVVILGIFNSAIVTWAWFYLLQREQAGKLGIYLFLTPVLGVLWAMLFANEQPHPASLIGGAFVLAAVFLKEFEGFGRRSRLKEPRPTSRSD